MSDHLLLLISDKPTRVPSATAREAAVRMLRQALPLADDVSSQVTDEVRFVDCGAMEAAHEYNFRDLQATLPCCAARLSLNDRARGSQPVIRSTRRVR